MRKNTIIYNSRSWDGIFCREIALKALRGESNVAVLSWEPGDPALEFPEEGLVYVLGLPLDAPFDSQVPHDCENNWYRLTWVHNHPDAIRNTDTGVPGLRIAGVANCRLAYAHFFSKEGPPLREAFVTNDVEEPYSLKLVQDKPTNTRANTADFFRGLARLTLPPDWDLLLSEEVILSLPYINALVQLGRLPPDALVHQGEPAVRPADRTAPRVVQSTCGAGQPSVQACPLIEDTWPIKDKPELPTTCPRCHGYVIREREGVFSCEACGWEDRIAREREKVPSQQINIAGGFEHLKGCGQGVCAICGSTTHPLHTVDYADKPIWICLGGCKYGNRKDILPDTDEPEGLNLSNDLLAQMGNHFVAHCKAGKWTFHRIAAPTVDELVCEQGQRIKESPLYPELLRWLDNQHITSDSIGSIRRRVLLPWNTEWNEIVRAETAARERSLT